MDSVAAKQFLISKVVEEANFEQVSLSEIEKKMLHFTEVHPSLPDIYEVNAEFERSYDADQYEVKVADLLKGARARDRAQSAVQDQQWKNAIDALKSEDHYILVMVYSAFPDYRKIIVPTHRIRDYAIYIAIGVGVVLTCIGIAIWRR